MFLRHGDGKVIWGVDSHCSKTDTEQRRRREEYVKSILSAGTWRMDQRLLSLSSPPLRLRIVELLMHPTWSVVTLAGLSVSQLKHTFTQLPSLVSRPVVKPLIAVSTGFRFHSSTKHENVQKI
ncbi:hypothetical protein AMELA_G00235450 [Ameiurus melas]|uniref:Uncharacterized protein n=1 Tax=Ameiurus melas TaxID=219545 RepID=A0A7J5ZYG8_AMEME|nr:hypothetical protein AMELA_G00235450 [Ameiurus melas]